MTNQASELLIKAQTNMHAREISRLLRTSSLQAYWNFDPEPPRGVSRWRRTLKLFESPFQKSGCEHRWVAVYISC